jgi:hypothetical protein
MRLAQEGLNRARAQLLEKYGVAYDQPYHHPKASMAVEAATCENAVDANGDSCGLPPMRCVCPSIPAVFFFGAALCRAEGVVRRREHFVKKCHNLFDETWTNNLLIKTEPNYIFYKHII